MKKENYIEIKGDLVEAEDEIFKDGKWIKIGKPRNNMLALTFPHSKTYKINWMGPPCPIRRKIKSDEAMKPRYMSVHPEDVQPKDQVFLGDYKVGRVDGWEEVWETKQEHNKLYFGSFGFFGAGGGFYWQNTKKYAFRRKIKTEEL